MHLNIKPIVLIILDGFGYSTEAKNNAIHAAHKPNWDNLWKTATHAFIAGSGVSVGLPQGQMGNSEVGHLNMGGGRIVSQDFTRIDEAITTHSFFENDILIHAIQLAKKNNKKLHVLGLLSPGGVHSHENHIHALIKLAAQQKSSDVYIHAFLDGRDTPPKSAEHSIHALEDICQRSACGQIVSLIGRYYAMDRDKRWERIKEAYDLLVLGQAQYHATSASVGLEMAYERKETDEFVQATCIHPANQPPITIDDGDVIIFMNFRSDRAREITQAFIEKDFTGFNRVKWPQLGSFVTLSEYDNRFNLPVAYPPATLRNFLGEYVSQIGLKQLRIAETEKYAHVTFFFNGGVEQPYPNEERILIPSPKVATYDLMPEMSAPELTDRLLIEIRKKEHDLIICNYANPDMVGHTGNFQATVKAIEVIDNCLGRIISTISSTGGEVMITADHGNAEKMFDYHHNQPHTAHTANLVPFIYFGRPAEIVKNDGKLSDIAPTLLTLMGLPIPTEMTGQPLLKLV